MEGLICQEGKLGRRRGHEKDKMTVEGACKKDGAKEARESANSLAKAKDTKTTKQCLCSLH